MGFLIYIAIYFIIWWFTLFLVLPFSGKSQFEAGEVIRGTVKSAPSTLKPWKLLFINTIIATVVFAVFYIVMEFLIY